MIKKNEQLALIMMDDVYFVRGTIFTVKTEDDIVVMNIHQSFFLTLFGCFQAVSVIPSLMGGNSRDSPSFLGGGGTRGFIRQ